LVTRIEVEVPSLPPEQSASQPPSTSTHQSALEEPAPFLMFPSWIRLVAILSASRQKSALRMALAGDGFAVSIIPLSATPPAPAAAFPDWNRVASGGIDLARVVLLLVVGTALDLAGSEPGCSECWRLSR
jgi:hypothetical protein